MAQFRFFCQVLVLWKGFFSYNRVMIQRVLKILFVIFLSLGVRIWYLTMVKHDEYRELASRPKQKVVIDVPNRGTIRDRFNIPLAARQSA